MKHTQMLLKCMMCYGKLLVTLAQCSSSYGRFMTGHSDQERPLDTSLTIWILWQGLFTLVRQMPCLTLRTVRETSSWKVSWMCH